MHMDFEWLDLFVRYVSLIHPLYFFHLGFLRLDLRLQLCSWQSELLELVRYFRVRHVVTFGTRGAGHQREHLLSALIGRHKCCTRGRLTY